MSKSAIIPCLRYRDATAAIPWLCTAFGFDRQAVHADADGAVVHAQLTCGDGMIMLGSVTAKECAWGRLLRQPDEIGDAETQSPYVASLTPMPSTPQRKRQAQKSCSTSRTKTTAVEDSIAAISRPHLDLRHL